MFRAASSRRAVEAARAPRYTLAIVYILVSFPERRPTLSLIDGRSCGFDILELHRPTRLLFNRSQALSPCCTFGPDVDHLKKKKK
jgi:hypothetical protein